jgi:hypothetical protein
MFFFVDSETILKLLVIHVFQLRGFCGVRATHEYMLLVTENRLKT